ncbi:proline-rich protein 18-like [Kryptolebias marmoratus]|uniref:proline-rich protein 18-like n=1 Tax=Kryptolebias marmoratus TaxID=37003 RepID=UPI0007F8DA5C|nr:proline-rich protein 18-like [Kryptolebias marmoratus]
MAEDASEHLSSLGKLVSSVVPSFFLYHKAELFSYLLLCVVKMPFIPQVSIVRSVSGLTGKERPGDASFASGVAKTKVQRDDKGSSVKERLTLNLKQLGRKSQLNSHPTSAKGVPAASGKRDRVLPSSQTDSTPSSSSGASLQHKHAGHSAAKKTEPPAKARARNQEEARFTLTLTPEAVLLLQRRNSERHQRCRNAASGAGASGSATDSRRRRQQSAAQRNGALNGRVVAKNTHNAEPGDIRSIVKISLLNDKHKYDDVEYEDEDEYGVDERVVLKCTEWLRGLENKPVKVGKSPNRSGNDGKGF